MYIVINISCTSGILSHYTGNSNITWIIYKGLPQCKKNVLGVTIAIYSLLTTEHCLTFKTRVIHITVNLSTQERYICMSNFIDRTHRFPLLYLYLLMLKQICHGEDGNIQQGDLWYCSICQVGSCYSVHQVKFGECSRNEIQRPGYFHLCRRISLLVSSEKGPCEYLNSSFLSMSVLPTILSPSVW